MFSAGSLATEVSNMIKFSNRLAVGKVGLRLGLAAVHDSTRTPPPKGGRSGFSVLGHLEGGLVGGDCLEEWCSQKGKEQFQRVDRTVFLTVARFQPRLMVYLRHPRHVDLQGGTSSYQRSDLKFA